MAASVAADHPFVRRELPPEEGRAFFAEREPAVQGRDPRRPRGEGEGRATARCRRRASTSTARSSTCARAPTSRARGRSGPSSCSPSPAPTGAATSQRPALQRIYGTVWATQEDLDAYLWRREEAKKRDHRRLGVQLDLFSFHDVSPGSAFWHPKGQRIWRTLEGAMRELQARHGYDEVEHADPREPPRLAAVGPLGPLPRQHVRPRHRGPAVLAQADELPREHVHLPVHGCARTATCRCATPSTAGSIGTSCPARCPG